jgi:hypothetical protein
VSAVRPPAAATASGSGGPARMLARHLGSERVARVTYGAIIGMALIVVLEKHPPASGIVVGTLLATALAVTLAELYSEVIGHQTRTRARVQRHHLRHLAGEVAAVGFGIAFPCVFFLAAVAGLLEEDTAFTLAKWSGLVLIGFYGFCAARLAGDRFLPALLQALAVAAVGALLIAFKAVVH